MVWDEKKLDELLEYWKQEYFNKGGGNLAAPEGCRIREPEHPYSPPPSHKPEYVEKLVTRDDWPLASFCPHCGRRAKQTGKSECPGEDCRIRNENDREAALLAAAREMLSEKPVAGSGSHALFNHPHGSAWAWEWGKLRKAVDAYNQPEPPTYIDAQGVVRPERRIWPFFWLPTRRGRRSGKERR